MNECRRCGDEELYEDEICRECFDARLTCEACGANFWPEDSRSEEYCPDCFAQMYWCPTIQADYDIGVYGLRYHH